MTSWPFTFPPKAFKMVKIPNRQREKKASATMLNWLAEMYVFMLFEFSLLFFNTVFSFTCYELDPFVFLFFRVFFFFKNQRWKNVSQPHFQSLYIMRKLSCPDIFFYFVFWYHLVRLVFIPWCRFFVVVAQIHIICAW